MQLVSLRRNFAWTLFGQVAYALSQWIAISSVAKLGTPEMLGRLALAQAICTPLVQFTNMNLRAVQATDRDEEYAFHEYVALRIVSTTIFLGLSVLIAVCLSYTPLVIAIVFSFGFAKAVESFSDVAYGALQQRENLRRIGISTAVRGVVFAVALALGVAISGSLTPGLWMLSVGWIAVLIAYDAPSVRHVVQLQSLAPRFSGRRLFTLTKLSIPLGFVTMLNAAAAYLPTYFLEHYQGHRAVGLFAAMAYFMLVTNTVLAALGRTVSPRLALYRSRGDKASFVRLLWKTAMLVVTLGGGGVLVAVLAGDLLLRLVYTPEYAKQSNVLVWLMLCGAVVALTATFGTAATSLRRFGVQMWIHIIRVTVLIVLCAWLVPEYGALGAAWSMLGCTLIALCAYAALVIIGIRAISSIDGDNGA